MDRHRGGTRTGVLVIRIWLDEGGRGGFRARISGSAGHGQADQPVAITATAAGVIAAVRAWMAGFMSSGRDEFWKSLER